jgi:hypothetical protein
VSARPDPIREDDGPVDLDIATMPSFLAPPRAANDALGDRPMLRPRRSRFPLLAAAGVGALALAGAVVALVGGPAPAPTRPVTSAQAILPPPALAALPPRPEPAPPPRPEPARVAPEPAPAAPQPVALPAAEIRTASVEPVIPASPPVPLRATVPPVEAPPPAPPAPLPPAPPPPASRVSPGDAERALKRAETLLEQGDISAARLLLERAAESGSGRALFRLAETYDPRSLQRWGARGIKGSPERAREFYRLAQIAGDAEAGARLAGLPAR